MPFDPNDPRLTAYALGELDESDIPAVEAILAESYDAQRFVDDVRATARLLRDELHAEPALGLSEEQKHLIDGFLTAPAASPVSRNGRARWFGYAVAASLLVGTGVLAVQMIRPKPNEPVQVALSERHRTSNLDASSDFDTAESQRRGARYNPVRDQYAWNEPAAPAAAEPRGFVTPESGAGLSYKAKADQSGLAGATTAPQPPRVTTLNGTPATPQMHGMMGMQSMGGMPGGTPAPGGMQGMMGGMGGIGGGQMAGIPASRFKARQPDTYAYSAAPHSGRPNMPGLATPSKPGANAPAVGPGLESAPAAEPSQTSNFGLSRAGGALGRPAQAAAGQGLPQDQLALTDGTSAQARFYAKVDGQPGGQKSALNELLSKKSKAARPDVAQRGLSAERKAGADQMSLPSITNGKQYADDKSGKMVEERLGKAEGLLARAEMDEAAKSPVSGPAPGEKPVTLQQEVAAGAENAAKNGADAPALHGENGRPLAREKEMVEQKAELALAPKDAEARELKEGLADVDALVAPVPAVEAPAAEDFAPIDENGFERVTDLPQPTLSIDVDTASYANVRRFLNQDQMPPRDAVRIEEMINYFRYDDPEPKGDDPFSVNVEIARCPWNVDHRIARIGLKGKSIDFAHRPVSNLVFLVDVSGSMQDENKLPLLKQSMKMLVENLGENDRVSIVVYAGSEGLALKPTSGDRKEVILSALEQLQAGGSTNGGAGINLAYNIATQNFIKGGVNRVILCTDGDFNVGVTDRGQLDKLIEEKAKSKVFLSVLGFGQGNLKDATMESLADKGNGNYAYIDSPKEGQKVLVDEAGATLVTIAKDVKVQVEFNPSHVAAYRLIGYENRVMDAQDFNNDQKDAGEIGAGHNVTVLFELVPPGKEAAVAGPPADDLIFQKREPIAADVSKLAMMVKLRYKAPEGDVSKLIQQGVEDTGKDYAAASNDLKFSSAVASFGMLLRNSHFKGSATYDSVLELASASKGDDKSGYRTEFLGLVRKAKELTQPR